MTLDNELNNLKNHIPKLLRIIAKYLVLPLLIVGIVNIGVLAFKIISWYLNGISFGEVGLHYSASAGIIFILFLYGFWFYSLTMKNLLITVQ